MAVYSMNSTTAVFNICFCDYGTVLVNNCCSLLRGDCWLRRETPLTHSVFVWFFVGQTDGILSASLLTREAMADACLRPAVPMSVVPCRLLIHDALQLRVRPSVRPSVRLSHGSLSVVHLWHCGTSFYVWTVRQWALQRGGIKTDWGRVDTSTPLNAFFITALEDS